MYGNSHEGVVFSDVRSLNSLAFMSGKHRVVGWARSLLASVCVCVVLLCLQVCRLFMCLFVQHDSRWKHV